MAVATGEKQTAYTDKDFWSGPERWNSIKSSFLAIITQAIALVLRTCLILPPPKNVMSVHSALMLASYTRCFQLLKKLPKAC